MAPKHELVKFCRTIIINKKYLNIWFCLNSLWKNSHHPGSEFHGLQPILQPLRPLWPHGVVPCRCTPLSRAAVATRGAGLHVASSWRGPDATHPISTLRGPWILRLDSLFYILLHLAGKCNEYQWVVYTSNAGESHYYHIAVDKFPRAQQAFESCFARHWYLLYMMHLALVPSLKTVPWALTAEFDFGI